MTPVDAPSDVLLRRLDRLLDERGLAVVWFARSNNFAWLTGGDNVVDRADEPGSAAVGYDGEGVTVVTSDIEGDRLAAEQLPDGVGVETYPWHSETLAGAVAATTPRPAAADFPVEGIGDVDATALRQPLTDSQIAGYRELGRTVASTVEVVCREFGPATTEREVAAALRGRLAERDVDAPVVLVGGERRAQAYRHYVPTGERVDGYALVSVTARRGGLHASCTRTVAFDPPAWLFDRHTAAARVEVAALAGTRQVGRAGGPAGDVFEAVQDAYAALDWAGEWRHHHQGGAAGFAGREWIATPDSDVPVVLPMAYAWNPTVRGAKSEGTVLVTADGYEPLTTTGDWPTVEASAPDGSATLARPAVLER